jgi:hypothetical protein
MMKLKNIYIARAKYVDDDDGVGNENGGESELCSKRLGVCKKRNFCTIENCPDFLTLFSLSRHRQHFFFSFMSSFCAC